MLHILFKAVIKANSGYFDGYINYYITSYVLIHGIDVIDIKNVENERNKEQTLDEMVCPNF